MPQVSVIDIVTYMVYGLVLLSIIAVLFLERKDPGTTLTWVLVLSYLPVVGLFFYIFFGRGLKIFILKKLELRNQIRDKYKELPALTKQAIDDTMRVINGEDFAFSDPKAQEYTPLMRMNFNLADALYTQDNGLKVYTSAREKYDELFADIRAARETVHLLYFIIGNSQIGHELLALLAQKAREGVKVRVIYDELGSFTTPRHMFNGLRKAGGEVYRFFPLKLGTLLRANYRNHRKIAVIDGKVAYTGGMNIGDEYMGLHPRKTPWRDTHLRVTGSAVQSLQLLFVLDLYYATENEALLVELLSRELQGSESSTGTVGMQVVGSGPDQEEAAIKRGMISMINSAKKSVYVQSPYLMPDAPVLCALQNAAKSGIHVVVMLPSIPDKRAVYYVTTSYIRELLDYGVEVQLYTGFLHAKMLVVDDTVCTIGTCNLDMRSFDFHFEVNCFIYDSAVAAQCGDIFRKDLKECKLVTREEYRKRGKLRIILERLLRLFAPLM